MDESMPKSRQELERDLNEAMTEIDSLRGAKERLTEREKEIEFRSEQMRAMLDGINEVIYVSDPDSYEVLFLNESAKQAFGDRVGEKCHKVLQNLDSPCTFCTNELIFGEYMGKSYIWEWQNKINKNWYRCIDRAIPWPDGRMVRYEMAIDVTQQKQAEQKMEQLYREIIELSTPVIQVWEGIVVAPLIGTLDSQRAQEFMERFLNEITATQSPVALIDITGVPSVDTGTAQNLIDAITAARHHRPNPGAFGHRSGRHGNTGIAVRRSAHRTGHAGMENRAAKPARLINGGVMIINESIAIFKVRDVLMISVPPDPDDETISLMQDQILNTMQKNESIGLIMDLSTVTTLDSFFARTIVETAQMVAIMGGRTIVAGMQSSVAITATQLGLTLDQIESALNVDRALDLLEIGNRHRRLRPWRP